MALESPLLPPEQGLGAPQWLFLAVVVPLVMLASGRTSFKVNRLHSPTLSLFGAQAVLPWLRFCMEFCSALIMGTNDDPKSEATMQRSREMKDAKKRENEYKERERQVAKAAEKERRKRKVSNPPNCLTSSACVPCDHLVLGCTVLSRWAH
jgi:hypothetical protein